LRPVAFTDPGTIATLVEEAVFWRVSEGGIGLPDIATPWDSPMPKWKDELTEEDRWKIIMAIYSDIGMEPRVLEMMLN
ncbi:MAG: cytochrome c, partial [Lentisphaeria bacterium]|nr:cytochrome c [Lentisphaeria bacterium]